MDLREETGTVKTVNYIVKTVDYIDLSINKAC